MFLFNLKVVFLVAKFLFFNFTKAKVYTQGNHFVKAQGFDEGKISIFLKYCKRIKGHTMAPESAE